MTPQDYIAAARVPVSLKPQKFGRWTIRRVRADEFSDHVFEQLVRYSCGRPMQTVLYRWTDATMHLTHGDVVMEDSNRELRRHLPIWMHGSGRVLVTGLGLGCVVRGLLESPHVEHIDVVEIDADIIRVVGEEFIGRRRVTIHHGNAMTFRWPKSVQWDYAWHDLYSDEGKLHAMHLKCMGHVFDRVKHRQGAWSFPSTLKRQPRHWLLK